MIVSRFVAIKFFQKIFFQILFKTINKNLHQSRAGIGNKLKTHKFIEMIAQIITKNTNQAESVFEMKFTTQIGQETLWIASCLSFWFSGVIIFLSKIQIPLKVIKTWFLVSKNAYFADSSGQYFSKKFWFIM